MDAQKREERNAQESPLLRLPRELRDEIWRLAYGDQTLHPIWQFRDGTYWAEDEINKRRGPYQHVDQFLTTVCQSPWTPQELYPPGVVPKPVENPCQDYSHYSNHLHLNHPHPNHPWNAARCSECSDIIRHQCTVQIDAKCTAGTDKEHRADRECTEKDHRHACWETAIWADSKYPTVRCGQGKNAFRVPVVCKRFWYEVEHMIYETCMFSFLDERSFIHFLNRKPPVLLQKIRRLGLTFIGTTGAWPHISQGWKSIQHGIQPHHLGCVPSVRELFLTVALDWTVHTGRETNHPTQILIRRERADNNLALRKEMDEEMWDTQTGIVEAKSQSLKWVRRAVELIRNGWLVEGERKRWALKRDLTTLVLENTVLVLPRYPIFFVSPFSKSAKRLFNYDAARCPRWSKRILNVEGSRQLKEFLLTGKSCGVAPETDGGPSSPVKNE